VEASQRAPLRGPTFIRLLARLTDAGIHHPSQSLSDRLSHWIDWPHAVALSSALDSKPAAASIDEQGLDGVGRDECARVRSSLTTAIVGDQAFSTSWRRESKQTTGEEPGDEAPDYAFFRQRYLAMQQAMETNVGHLRGRLREMLGLRTADMTRLAAVDAVMERVLGRRERTLLSTAPVLLGAHFERLRQSALESPTAAPGPWLETFRKDMRSVLLAELDVRMHPAEGLLAALHTRPGKHVQKSA
jgi:hypothetical protein